jgi:hypothetical protein
VVILAVFQLPTTHAYLVHSNRFFMAPTVLSIPLIAQGLQIIYQQVIKYRTVLQVSWGVPILMLGVNIPIMGRFDSRMQDWISHACTVLPDNAMVFAAGDGAVFGLQLAQAQLRMCGHVDVVFPKLLVYQWYQKDLVDRGIQGEDMTSIIRMQPPDRPIFSVLGLSNQKGLPSSFPFAGVWMKFVPNANMLPAPKQVVDQLSHYAQQYPVSESLHPFLESRTAERWPAEQWAHSWWSLVPAFEAMEDLSSADISRDRGERWLPQE